MDPDLAAQILEELTQLKHPDMQKHKLKTRWEMIVSKLRTLQDREATPSVQRVAQWIKDTLLEVNSAWQVMRAFLEPAQVTAIASMEEWEKLYRAGNRALREHGDRLYNDRKRRREDDDRPIKEEQQRYNRRTTSTPCEQCGNPHGHNRSDGICVYADKGHPHVNTDKNTKWADSFWGKIYTANPDTTKNGEKRTYLQHNFRLEKTTDNGKEGYKYIPQNLQGVRGDTTRRHKDRYERPRYRGSERGRSPIDQRNNPFTSKHTRINHIHKFLNKLTSQDEFLNNHTINPFMNVHIIPNRPRWRQTLGQQKST